MTAELDQYLIKYKEKIKKELRKEHADINDPYIEKNINYIVEIEKNRLIGDQSGKRELTKITQEKLKKILKSI